MPMAQHYDALLIVSFGGPEGPDDVVPFLENVLRGKNVPRKRMLEVAKHYQLFGGVSPINAENRALIEALRDELAEHGPELPIYWGNRNWHPLLVDTLAEMAGDRVTRALAFVTSAYSSYSGCRQYLEDIEQARKRVGRSAPQVDKIRAFYNHPRFIEATVARVGEALGRLAAGRREEAQLLFTAHSIPEAMARGCRYEEQLREAARLVVEQLGGRPWQLVYQSRSGPPSQPWLEPDVCDAIRQLAAEGDDQPVVLVPIGFVMDHLEVVYDLDVEARAVCAELGIEMVRAGTAGTHPAFATMVRELIVERMSGQSERMALGRFGPSHDVCPADCCPSGRANTVLERRPGGRR